LRSCEAAKKKVAEFDSQNIANTLNALAKFGVYDDKSQGKVAEFNSQDIANTLNALAKFGVRDDRRV